MIPCIMQGMMHDHPLGMRSGRVWRKTAQLRQVDDPSGQGQQSPQPWKGQPQNARG